MRLLKVALALGLLVWASEAPIGQIRDRAKLEQSSRGTRLDALAWPEAESLLRPDSIVVIPLGAGSKEHGPHLKLKNDLTLADYLTRRVIAQSPVIVAPTLTYHFYPAFVEYPGTTSLTQGTARDMTADVVRSLARYGPRRFYVLNTGISTVVPLSAAAKLLSNEGVLLHYTDLKARTDGAARTVQQQPGGTHADEIETSMMLYVDPTVVDMTRAVREYVPAPPGPLRLTRQPNGAGTYSQTGVWGDPTLATAAKGRVIVEALVAGILDDIDQLSKAPLPQGALAPVATPPRPEPSGRGLMPGVRAAGCSAGDERVIRGIGPAFSLHWANQDVRRLAGLWATEGDIAHPDGSVERTSQVIRQNRAYLFTTVEYRASRHFLGIGNIRCLTDDVAVADGKWELREVVDANRRALPPMDGLCTLVLRRGDGGWAIEAYRYTINPRAGSPPTFLKQPGFINK